MSSQGASWILPEWDQPAGVHSLISTRSGGISTGVYSGLNFGDHVGDEPERVAANRNLLLARIGARPVWLGQVHGVRVVDAADFPPGSPVPQADAAFTRKPGVACAVMTADCLPVLMCDESGTVVAAAHAGWRGLLAGVLENTVLAMEVPGVRLMACLGPAIGPQAFTVGDEVRNAFVAADAAAAAAFVSWADGFWLADLYALARQRLARAGVQRVAGGGFCTYSDPQRFFSYRRDGRTGRMVSVIWRVR